MRYHPIHYLVIIAALLAARPATAAVLTVVDAAGAPLATVMLTQRLVAPNPPDTSDNFYQQPGRPHATDTEITKFTDDNGQASWRGRTGDVAYRLRKPGYKDGELIAPAGLAATQVTMHAETDPILLAAAKPANAWLGALNLGGEKEKQHFQMQCTFCHQIGNAFTRIERSPQDWKIVIDRMVRYGSRLPTVLQKSLPDQLSANFKTLREHPELISDATSWRPSLATVTVTEWPLGDAMSQTHDLLIGASGLLYVADNIQDRLYEIDTTTNAVTVYKIPHREGDQPGGLIAGRLKDFPRHDSTSNAHSLAQSTRDGHIFITPSAQRRLVEFDPVTKAFRLHEMEEGFYPHTIRVDAKDRVWFTLALSNQIARFDRSTESFTYFDLPARSFKEKLISSYIGVLFKLIGWGLPLANWLPIDWESSGVPLPYGIDVAPDGKIWFTRLHSREIGVISPESGTVEMLGTPFLGPRRLRADAEGNLWITVFPESKIARYNPVTHVFDQFDLPVSPVGSDAPYALNVDKQRGIVWVNGNQSDSLYAFDISSETWRAFPLPRRTTFTRDVEIAADGTVYTANSAFPSWHIEDAQPTLIRVEHP